MIIWDMLDLRTKTSLIAAFPGFRAPYSADPGDRGIIYKPVIRIEEIEATMRQIPRGPGK